MGGEGEEFIYRTREEATGVGVEGKGGAEGEKGSDERDNEGMVMMVVVVRVKW